MGGLNAASSGFWNLNHTVSTPKWLRMKSDIIYILTKEAEICGEMAPTNFKYEKIWFSVASELKMSKNWYS